MQAVRSPAAEDALKQAGNAAKLENSVMLFVCVHTS